MFCRELVVANDTCGEPCSDTSEMDEEPCNTHTCKCTEIEHVYHKF